MQKKKIIIKKVSYIHVNDLSIFFLVYTINLIDENWIMTQAACLVVW